MMHEAISITSYKSKITKMHLANFLPQEAMICIGGGAWGEKGGGRNREKVVWGHCETREDVNEPLKMF